MEREKEKMPSPRNPSVTVYYVYGSLVDYDFEDKHKNLPKHKHIQTFSVPHDHIFDQNYSEYKDADGYKDTDGYAIIGVKIFSLESGQNSRTRLPDTMRTDYVALYEKFREACLDLEIPMEKGEFFTVAEDCKCCT